MNGENKIKYVHVQLAGKNTGKEAWLGLPADADRLGRAFSSLGIEKAEDLQIKEVVCPYKGIGKYLSGADNLDALNTVAVFLSDMRDHELVLACAIAEMNLSQFGENTLGVLLNVLGDDDNLNGFEVIDAANETELGRYWAAEEHLEFASEAEYAAYGRENMEDGGMFTEWGYVRCVFKPQMLYDSEKLPEGCQVMAAALRSSAQEAGSEYPAVYPYSADVARQSGELDLYRESNKLNRSCAQAIGAAIRDCNYKLFHYDLPAAAQSAISEYGAGRVQWVLAHTVQSKEWDGRFSNNNKEWAKGFDIPESKFSGFAVETHPSILDSFINQVRMALLEKELQFEHPGALTSEYKYYAVRHPIVGGDLPRKPKPEAVYHFDSKMFVENSAFSAWGSVIYKEPLTDQQAADFGLRAASANPREKPSVLDSLKKGMEAGERPKPEKPVKKSGPEL